MKNDQNVLRMFLYFSCYRLYFGCSTFQFQLFLKSLLNVFLCIFCYYGDLLDIHEGNLKSILTLFFNISRYKQSLKKHQQQQYSSGTGTSPGIKSPNQSLYQNGDPMTLSSCTSGEEDDNTNGFMTDFSISSSTQSLILSSNGKNFETSTSNMVPPPTSGVMISRYLFHNFYLEFAIKLVEKEKRPFGNRISYIH